MIYVVIAFFFASLVLYTILGGADFGAGIIELFAGRKKKHQIRHAVTEAMAPIWEANHIWLIIAVVILFNGFPGLFERISISLHIPVLILLVGIVLRGTAFTFRHYDAYQDNSQEFYSVIFSISSFMVAMGFGIIMASVIGGTITVEASTFHEAYIQPWFTVFGHATGLFIACLFAFLAAVFLIGETTDISDILWFRKAAKRSLIAMVLTGAIVFGSALYMNAPFFQQFTTNVWSLSGMGLATLLLPLLWWFLNRDFIWAPRITAGFLVLLVVGAFFLACFPTAIYLADAEDLTFFNAAAPEITQFYLGSALLGGGVLIFPSLWILFRVFKLQSLKP